jgi:hypothetical protein
VSEVQKISSVTLDEWIILISTLYSIEEEKFDCSKCLKKYAQRTDYEAMTAKLRLSKSCESFQSQPVHQIEAEGVRLSFTTCIGNFKRPSMLRWVEAHRQYQTGILPFSGGFLDQPNKVIEIFNLISSEQNRRREAQVQKQRLMQASRLGGARGRR